MGYKGILKEDGLLIPDEDALIFALWRVLCRGEGKEQFIEWFFSGNWLEAEEDEAI